MDKGQLLFILNMLKKYENDIMERIKKLRRDAVMKGIPGKAEAVAVAFGRKNYTGYGYEYIYSSIVSGLKIVFDSYGGNIAVYWMGKRVFSCTGKCGDNDITSYIPGKWEEIISKLYEDAEIQMIKNSICTIVERIADYRKTWGIDIDGLEDIIEKASKICGQEA